MDFRESLIPVSSLDDVATKGAQSLNRKLKIAARVRLRYVYTRRRNFRPAEKFDPVALGSHGTVR